MKIVKFKNGKYGVRRWTIAGFQFLSNNGNWWGKDKIFDYVIEHTKEEATRLYRALSDMGEPE